MPAKPKRTKRKRPDPNYYRAQLEERVQARRALCSQLLFWRACGHKPCLRARACARASNDCFDSLWPLVPQEMKICIRASIEASVAGLSRPEIKAAIARALARWRATQAPPAAENFAPEPVELTAAPPRRIDAPAWSGPRVRML
jgi:hypothetical protein